MKSLKLETLVRQWQDAELNCAPKRQAQLTDEIMGTVNQDLEEIKQTPRDPKFEWRFEALYEALKPMAYYLLRLQLMEKAGIHPEKPPLRPARDFVS